MREKASQLALELTTLKTLVNSNEKKILSHFINEYDNYWIITHQLSGGGINIVNEKTGDYESGIARDCCALYQRIYQSNDIDLLKIKELCSVIFYQIVGYRIQDANKAPDMVKSFTKKTLAELLTQPRKYKKHKNKEEIEEEIALAKKRSIEEPNIISNLMIGIPIIVIVWFILVKFYSGSDRYSFNVFVIMGLVLGLLGMEGHYHLLSKLAIKVRYYFYLYKWKFEWKCFEIPSKIKYLFENKRMYIYPFLIVWYFIVYLIAR